jgi:hypothetical protein
MSGSIANTGSVDLSGSDAIVSATSDDTSNSTATGTRSASQTPFASNSVFNLPIGSGAQWQGNEQLSSANVFVNTTDSGFNENIYTGTGSDPVVTVTNDASAGGTAGTFQVHIPSGAVPSSGSDSTLSVDDTTTGTWYSFGGFNRTGADTATAVQGSAESDTGSGIQVDGSDWDQGVGTLRESDLQSGAIDHTLRMELPTDMLQSFTNSAFQLAPNAWPQTQEDGNGPSVYSGTVPYGVTVGIPAGTPEPAAVAANPGADMLWQALQDHGAMVRDSGGSGNTVIFQADQNVNPSDPLIQGMEQFGAQIMAASQILTNQGPNSINGGGTPIVALDAQVGNASVSAAVTAPTTTPATTASTSSSTTPSSTDPTTSPSTDPTTSPSTDPTTSPSTTPTTSPSTGNTTSSDTATITPSSLSSGQSGSAGSSGMTFVTTPDTSSGTASSGSSPSVDTAPTFSFPTAPSTHDFTALTASIPTFQDGSLTTGQGNLFMNHVDPSAMAVPQT